MPARTEGSPAPETLHDLLLESADITGFLREFTTMPAHRLSTGDTETECAVTLLRQRKTITVASSDPRAQALDETQNQHRHGPCLTTMRQHTVVRVGDVRTDGRWPGHRAAATDQGIASIPGVPLRSGRGRPSRAEHLLRQTRGLRPGHHRHHRARGRPGVQGPAPGGTPGPPPRSPR